MFKVYIVWKQEQLYDEGYILNIYSAKNIALQAYPKAGEPDKGFPKLWVEEWSVWNNLEGRL